MLKKTLATPDDGLGLFCVQMPNLGGRSKGIPSLGSEPGFARPRLSPAGRCDKLGTICCSDIPSRYDYVPFTRKNLKAQKNYKKKRKKVIIKSISLKEISCQWHLGSRCAKARSRESHLCPHGVSPSSFLPLLANAQRLTLIFTFICTLKTQEIGSEKPKLNAASPPSSETLYAGPGRLNTRI